MAFGDQDVSLFFRDGDVALREAAGKAGFMCYFDIPERLDMPSLGGPHGAAQIDAKPQIRYATADAPDLDHNEVISVRGASYRVRNPHLEGDGLVSVADLAAANA